MYNVRLSGDEYDKDSGTPIYPQRVYAATREDCRWISFPFLLVWASLTSSGDNVEETYACCMVPYVAPIFLLGAVDLPFSLVTDTVMLPCDLAGKGRIHEPPRPPIRPSNEFVPNVGQANTNVPSAILISSSGYPDPKATLRILPREESVVVRIDDTFRCGDPPQTYRLVYSDPESVVILMVDGN